MSETHDLRDNIVSSLLVSPHFTIRTALPLLLAGLADAHGFREAALGDLGSAYSAGSLLSAFAAVLWADRAVRMPVLFGLVVGALGVLSILSGAGYPMVFAGFLLAGIGYGAAYSWMLSALAWVAHPSRTLGWQWSVGTLPGMAFLMLIPLLGSGSDGVRHTFLAILLANLLPVMAALPLPAVPPTLPVRVDRTAATVSDRRGVLLAAVALFALYAGCTGGWSLLARVAVHDGLASGFAGFALSLATATSCVVALLIVRWGERGGHPMFMTLGIALMMAGLACVAFWSGRVGFVVGVLLFIALSAYTLTYCGGLIARRSSGASSAGTSAIALGSGAILGPAAAGHLYEAFGPRTMLLAAAVTLAVGLVAYLAAARSHRPRR